MFIATCVSPKKKTRGVQPQRWERVRAACAKSVRQQWKTFPEVQVAIGSTPQGLGITVANESLVGGFSPTHLKNMQKSNWKSSPNRDEHKKYLKPPPRSVYVGIPDPKID